MEQIQTLYPEYKGEPDTWRIVSLPPIDEKFIKKLEALGEVAGHKRFRIVDGSRFKYYDEGDEFLDAGKYLKYMVMRDVPYIDGFLYYDKRQNGYVHVKNDQDAPKDVMVMPNYKTRSFGRPRYIVEVYRQVGEPGIKESGYVFAWAIEKLDIQNIGGQLVQVSTFRKPDDRDIEQAQRLLHIIRSMSKNDIITAISAQTDEREQMKAERQSERREIIAEAGASYLTDEKRILRDAQELYDLAKEERRSRANGIH